MLRKLRLAYIAHSLRSDWNNGNAHFLRGLLRSMGKLGHTVQAFEPERSWSLDNLRVEPEGDRSLEDFARAYPDLDIRTYPAVASRDFWRESLAAIDGVILHEWNPPALAKLLLELRSELGFRLLFHDTHHRASSSPRQIEAFGLSEFDGILVFGEVLRQIYRKSFGIERVWVLHEAADTTLFRPMVAAGVDQDVVWIGNWGDGERSAEIREFLLAPAAALRRRTAIFGVRYPPEGLKALRGSGVRYGGYLPNIDAPGIYARSRLTVHIPRRQYSTQMPGIPTIRIFEALACGIPLISAPWQDSEHLFRPGDFRFVGSGAEMQAAMRELLRAPEMAKAQAARGLETVLGHHTCDHRAQELTAICQELLR